MVAESEEILETPDSCQSSDLQKERQRVMERFSIKSHNDFSQLFQLPITVVVFVCACLTVSGQ